MNFNHEMYFNHHKLNILVKRLQSLSNNFIYIYDVFCMFLFLLKFVDIISIKPKTQSLIFLKKLI